MLTNQFCIAGDGVIVQSKRKGRKNEIEGEPNAKVVQKDTRQNGGRKGVMLILSIVTNYDDRSLRSYYCYKQWTRK